MSHTGFPSGPGPSLLRRLTVSSSIIKGRISLLSCPLGQAVGHGPERSLAAALAQSPLSSSLAAFAEGLEGAGTTSTNFVQIFQLFKLAGLHIALGTPQELIASRVFIRHLPVHQVPLLHPHLGEQLPGLPIDEVFLPRHTLILLSAPQITSSGAWPSSTAIRHKITTRRPALGNLCPSLSISLRVRPREGTRISVCSLGSTSFTSKPKTSCKYSEA